MASGGSSLLLVHRLLIAMSPLAAKHRLWGTQSSVIMAPGPTGQSCGAQSEFSGANGILPDQGSSLCLLHWQADSLP